MTNQSIKWMNCCFDKLFLNDRIVKSASDGACCVTCKSGFHSSPNVPFQIWGGQGRGQGDGQDFHSSPNAPFQIDHSLPILSWWFSHPPPYGDRSYLQSSLIVSGGAKDWTSQLYQSSWNRLLGNSSLYLSISKEVIDLSLKQNFCHFNRKISQLCATQVITWINPNTSVQVFIYLGQRVKLGTKGEKARPVPSSFNQKYLQNVTAPFKKFLHFRWCFSWCKSNPLIKTKTMSGQFHSFAMFFSLFQLRPNDGCLWRRFEEEDVQLIWNH